MPRYYCDYCDTYLTHDSPSVRKQHNAGYKHKANVRSYYQQFEEQQTQSFIDQKVKEHLGQTAAFHQHLTALQSGQQRPRIPVLPPPTLPVPGSSQALHNQLLSPAVRLPVLPRPTTGPPGNITTLSSAPALRPPGAPLTLPPGIAQPNGLPRPPALNSPAATGLRPATPTSTSPPMANGLMSAPPHSGAPSTYQNQQPNSMTTSGAYATYSYTSPTSFS